MSNSPPRRPQTNGLHCTGCHRQSECARGSDGRPYDHVLIGQWPRRNKPRIPPSTSQLHHDAQTGFARRSVVSCCELLKPPQPLERQPTLHADRPANLHRFCPFSLISPFPCNSGALFADFPSGQAATPPPRSTPGQSIDEDFPYIEARRSKSSPKPSWRLDSFHGRPGRLGRL